MRSAIVKKNDGCYVKKNLGRIVKKISSRVSKVYYAGGFLKDNGHYYEYKISSNKIKLIPYLRKRGSIFKYTLDIFNEMKFLKKFILNSDFVYIMMPGFRSLAVASLCLYLGKPYCLYYGNSWGEIAKYCIDQDKKIKYKLYIKLSELFEKLFCKRASFILVHGNMLKEEIEKYNRRVFLTVPKLYIDSTDINNDLVRKQLNNKINILYVGNVTKRKGLEYLIKAIIRLNMNYKYNFNLTVVGNDNTDYKDQLNERYKETIFYNKINFLGYIYKKIDLLKLYKNSDIFVLPSNAEGFPRVIYEAFSQKLPVITTNIINIRKEIDNNIHAILVEPENPEAIVNAILRIINNSKLRKRIINNGLKYVKNKLNSNTPSDQLYKLISKDLNERL